MAERANRGGGARVDSVALTIPGRNAAFGRRVAEQALTLVAAGLPPDASGQYGALKLRVRVRGTGEQEMSEAVANALLRALARRSG